MSILRREKARSYVRQTYAYFLRDPGLSRTVIYALLPGRTATHRRNLNGLALCLIFEAVAEGLFSSGRGRG